MFIKTFNNRSLLVLFGVIIFIYSCNEKRITNNFGLLSEREIIDTEFVLKKQVEFKIDLIQKQKDSLFFYEFMSRQFHVYSANTLDFKFSFGSYGNAPFEYLNVVKYEVIDSIIKTFDNQAKIIKEQLIGTNKIVNINKVPFDFSSFAFNGSEYLISSRSGTDARLSFIKMSSDFNTSSEVFIPEEFKFPFSALSYNGYFLENKNYKIYFSFETDHFIVFDTNFNYVNKIELNYKTQTPLFNMEEKGLVKDDKSQEVNIHGKIDENYLYILSAVDDTENNYIDVYNLKNMKYEKSYAIPKFTEEQLREFYIDGDYIYVSNHNFIGKLIIK